MTRATASLLLLLHSLPTEGFFNVVKQFGSRSEGVFSESVQHNQETVGQVIKTALMMRADSGGTRLIAPLEQVLAR